MTPELIEAVLEAALKAWLEALAAPEPLLNFAVGRGGGEVIPLLAPPALLPESELPLIEDMLVVLAEAIRPLFEMA